MEKNIQQNPITLTILGSTGSIGDSAVRLIEQNRNKIHIKCLVAGANAHKLADQAIKLNAEQAIIADNKQYTLLKELLSKTKIKAKAGRAAVLEAASMKVDCVVGAIVGIAGLQPCLEALKAGSKLALANKEAMVCAGSLMRKVASEKRTLIKPVDSEHHGLATLLKGQESAEIDAMILTASGGPFRTWPREKFEKATIQEALNHPTWAMGRKISIDSATMANKGLEVIEAHALFDMAAEKVKVKIHPQSFIHAMLVLKSGEFLTHMGVADMALPLLEALNHKKNLSYQSHLRQNVEQAYTLPSLTFEEPRWHDFPMLTLAYQALKAGQKACIFYNAANEVAVDAFLKGIISFGAIGQYVEEVLNEIETKAIYQINAIEDILALNEEARERTKDMINQKRSSAHKSDPL